MDVIRCDTDHQVADHAASELERLVSSNPRAVLGLPSGSTPLPVYERLAASPVDFTQCRVVMLDEYVGLSRGDAHSFGAYLHTHVIGPLGITADNLEVLDGAAADLDAECARYETVLARHRPDIQLLGIGRNGHIAFNEPGSAHDSVTRVVALSDTTRRDNARSFGGFGAVPTRALTQGIGTILHASRILLLATGEAKSAAVAATRAGPVTEQVPASALQRHPHTSVVVDAAAASSAR